MQCTCVLGTLGAQKGKETGTGSTGQAAKPCALPISPRPWLACLQVLSRLNRRGPRERQLHHNLRKKYSLICSRLTGEVRRLPACLPACPVAAAVLSTPCLQIFRVGQCSSIKLTRPPSAPLCLAPSASPPVSACLQPRMEYRMEAIPRPAPLIPGQAQTAVEELAAQVASSAVQETKDKLAAFLEETQKVGVELDAEGGGGGGSGLAGMREQLAACGDAPALCTFLLQLEAVYCHAGEGLPRGARQGGTSPQLLVLHLLLPAVPSIHPGCTYPMRAKQGLYLSGSPTLCPSSLCLLTCLLTCRCG